MAKNQNISLDDKYDLSKPLVFLSGTQAIVRLTLMQKERDRTAGKNTAGYVTGYRGSPLGGLDQQFMRARRVLEKSEVKFQAGLNEDLAATALWGSQQAELTGEGKYDGVFGIWYGKGPGVDRTGDVFRHANFAGTSKNGGVIALMGDDHTCESSTTAHQSEFHFVDVMIPILNPAGVQELIDYGLHGFAMARFCGTWVGIKCVKETIESTAVVDVSSDRVKINVPDFKMPPGGLNIRRIDGALAQEARLQEFKRDAMLAYVRANGINRIIMSGGPNAKIGIITTGKSYLDVRLALDELGIDEVKANELGIRLFKIGCPWPMDPGELRDFAKGLDLIMVVEEKRSLIEVQVREELYGTENQPVCVGKKDEKGEWLFPSKGALDPNDIAIAIGERVLRSTHNDAMAENVSRLKQAQEALSQTTDVATRTPYFCSGCPHNTSTVVPEGMRAYAGIGCHTMAIWMNRNTMGFTHMGGEGANWVGEAPFSKRNHVFQNLGDGTYNHSGILAIRAAVASGVNITYKILFNDAVAMTGGQRHEGGLTVDAIARQVAAEGMTKIVLVTDEPWKYPKSIEFPKGMTIHHRDELDKIQRMLAEVPGATAMIYDQTCAAEKRRRRKRNEYPDPDKRVIINELVCEGCGDCGVQSNCVSVQPVETEWGRKRTIDQTSCNKDFSCVKGFCPSFVTVSGAKLKKATGLAGALKLPDVVLPEPKLPAINGTFGVIITGIGGTGIVTIAQVLGTAAHIEGIAAGIIDMAGLAQKGGAVASHLRFAKHPDDIHAIRVPARGAHLILGGDIVTVGSKKVLSSMRSGETTVVVNTHETLPGDFTRNADFSLPTERLKREIAKAADADHAHFIDATKLSAALFGSSVTQNMFLVGYAYQFGGVPISSEAIFRAIELNGEAVEMNKQAFNWGRLAAVDPQSVADIAKPAEVSTDGQELSETLDEVIARREKFLTAYQNASYGARYRGLVEKVRSAETNAMPGQSGLADAVARYLFKLMAYKDEYEVARLYTDGSFIKQLKSSFDGDLKLKFHLAPPLLSRIDPNSGRPKKIEFGGWMFRAFGVLAKFKFLRGTALDPFGYGEERKVERSLITDYEKLVGELLAKLNASNHAVAVALAALPEKIRGFGPVKAASLVKVDAERKALLSRFESTTAKAAPVQAAAE